jgi:bacteriocin-like protein
MEKIMRESNDTSKLESEDRELNDAELNAVSGGFFPTTHVFLRTSDKREAGSENIK